jgi:histidinol-phosphate aminotransferase
MSYFRKNIDAMAGYKPGEQPQGGRFIKLNTNENPYPPSPKVIEAIRKFDCDRLRLYPDPIAQRFRETAGSVLGVPAECILACNGSDDALTILTRACVDENGLLVSPTPSYPLYHVLAQIQNARMELRPFTADWQLPENFTQHASLAIIANPNSPTGTAIPPDRILSVAQAAKCLVVADEAYADFTEENCIPLIPRCERLVVTRSLSKSYGLAGIRFGFIVAQPAIIESLMKVKDSYNCDAISIVAATAALADQEYFHSTRAKIIATRRRLQDALVQLGFSVLDSHANFVWIQRPEPVEPLYLALKERQIFIRYLRFAGYGEGLRISVGTNEEIDAFLEAIRSLV